MIKQLKSLLKRPLRKLLQKSFQAGVNSVQEQFAYRTVSYSQFSEDVSLDNFFPYKPYGFYVDVGAYHPQRFSNTKIFYDRGWQGLNIEPHPDVVELFRAQRPRDINLCMGVSQQSGKSKYYQFQEPALNTFDDEIRKKYEGNGDLVIQILEIDTEPLRVILENHLPPGQRIDFLSVDVEGMDAVVLESNDWEKYRPSIVLVETLHHRREIQEVMKRTRYKMIGQTYATIFFASQEFLSEREDIYAW